MSVELLLIFLISPVIFAIDCKDETGNSVDWFVAYKLPRIENSLHDHVKNGTGYSYITSNSVDNLWTLSELSISDSNSMFGLTLARLYENEDILSLLYNDQSPNEPVSMTHGHTKGVIMADRYAGFWLVHSVPHFPLLGNYSYPSSGHHNGQSFLCVSLNRDQFLNIGKQLAYNYPKVYYWKTSADLNSLYSSILSVAKGFHIRHPPYYNLKQIQSKKGINFQVFAKTSLFKKDLYADWVAPSLNANLYVQSWPNGPGRLPSTCNQTFRVMNVLDTEVNGINFHDQEDHSKWAVEAGKNGSYWICIGDINRMETQETRSGGTVCFQNLKLHLAYLNSVKKIEDCN